MKKTFVIGIGSILRGDDGVGVSVIDALRGLGLSCDVRLISGDVSGLDLIKYFPSSGRAIIIDAADMKESPGTIKVFDSRDIKPSDFNDKFSTHGMGLLETLTLAKKLSINCEITIVGIQPESIDYCLKLSDTIEKKIPFLVDVVKNMINPNFSNAKSEVNPAQHE